MHTKNLRGTCGAAMLFALGLLGCAPASQADPASRVWDWTYTGTDIKAEGTMTTEATPDSDGFYRIVAIAGRRNGSTITLLWPQGTAIPGNEPHAVDNRIKLGAPQLTKAGFRLRVDGWQLFKPVLRGLPVAADLSRFPFATAFRFHRTADHLHR